MCKKNQQEGIFCCILTERILLQTLMIAWYITDISCDVWSFPNVPAFCALLSKSLSCCIKLHHLRSLMKNISFSRFLVNSIHRKCVGGCKNNFKKRASVAYLMTLYVNEASKTTKNAVTCGISFTSHNFLLTSFTCQWKRAGWTCRHYLLIHVQHVLKSWWNRASFLFLSISWVYLAWFFFWLSVLKHHAKDIFYHYTRR